MIESWKLSLLSCKLKVTGALLFHPLEHIFVEYRFVLKLT